MAINPYLNLETSSNYQVFDFESIGRLTLKKRAKLDLIDETEQLYSLSLCTVLSDGREDFETESKNGDMDAVLETVAYIADIFSNKFPERKIFFRGSNAARSRKYQMGVKKYLEAISKTFTIEGVIIDESANIILREDFQNGKNYDAMIFTRKN